MGVSVIEGGDQRLRLLVAGAEWDNDALLLSAAPQVGRLVGWLSVGDWLVVWGFQFSREGTSGWSAAGGGGPEGR